MITTNQNAIDIFLGTAPVHSYTSVLMEGFRRMATYRNEDDMPYDAEYLDDAACYIMDILTLIASIEATPIEMQAAAA